MNIKNMFQLAFARDRKNPIRFILTFLLLSASLIFSCFSLAIARFDIYEEMAASLKKSINQEPYVVVQDFRLTDSVDKEIDAYYNKLGDEELSYMEEMLGTKVVRIGVGPCKDVKNPTVEAVGFYDLWNVDISSVEYGNAEAILKREKIFARAREAQTYTGTDVLWVEEEALISLGGKIVAGHMPEKTNEVAISATYCDLMMEDGYRQQYDGRVFYFTSYEEFIGHTFITNQEVRVTICGIVDTTEVQEVATYASCITSSMFFTREYVEEYFSDYYGQLVFEKPDDVDAFVEKYLAYATDWMDRISYYTDGTDQYDKEAALSLPMKAMEINGRPTGSYIWIYNYQYYETIYLKIGIPLFVFALPLAYFLVSTNVRHSRRSIGILKSCGAKNRDIYAVYLLESAVLGASCAVSVTIGAGILLHIVNTTYISWGMLCPAPYDFVNFIWHLGICLFITLSSGVFPIHHMLKQPIVSLLRDEEGGKGKKKHNQKAYAPPKKTAYRERTQRAAPADAASQTTTRERTDGTRRKTGLSPAASLKMGASGIRNNPIRFGLTVFLLSFALAFLGTAASLADYKEEDACAYALTLEEFYVVQKGDGSSLGLGVKDDAAALTGATLYPIFTSVGECFLFPYTVNTYDFDEGNTCLSMATSFIYADEAFLAQCGAVLYGSLPENEDEIALTACMAQTFVLTGYSPEYSADGVREDGYEWESISSPEEMIGKTLTANFGSETRQVTVVGVVDTGCENEHNTSNSLLEGNLHDKCFVSAATMAKMQSRVGAEADILIGAPPQSRAEAQTYYRYLTAGGYSKTVFAQMQAIIEQGNTLTQLKTIAFAVAAGVAVFSAVMIYQFISLSLEVKKKEIGVIRALGGSKKDVVKIFLSESMILAAVACGVSYLLTWGMTALVKSYLFADLTALGFLVPAAYLYPVVFLASEAVTILSALYPILREAKKPPVYAIREGEI